MVTLLQFLAALPALIKALYELMLLAEQAFPDSGTGMTKKEYIMAAIKALFEIGDSLWEKISGAVSAVVNLIAVFKLGSKLPEEPAK